MRPHLPLPLSYRLAQLVAPLLRGNRLECPICGGRFRRFLTASGRKDALCPGCGSLERHRLLWLYLRDRTAFFRDRLRVLHIAPEHCFLYRFQRLANLEHVSADIDSPFADVRMDVQQIPYGDESFDVIFCSHVLDDVTDDRKAMRELLRVLVVGGFAILQSPMQPGREVTIEAAEVPEEERASFFDLGSVRRYGLDYYERLRGEGFEVEVLPLARELGPGLVSRYGLEADDDICVCSKPAV